MKGITELIQSMALLIVGIIVLSFFIVYAVPTIYHIVYGGCYADGERILTFIQTEFSQLYVGQEKKVFITIGDCVDAVLFVNKNHLEKTLFRRFPSIEDEFNCSGGYKTVLAIAPKIGESAGFWVSFKRLTWDKDPRDMIVYGKELGKEKLGLNPKPICKALACRNCTFVKDETFVRGTETKENYCLTLSRPENEKYDVFTKKVSSKDEC